MTRLNLTRRMTLCTTILAITASAASADVILSIDPSMQSVGLGSQANVDLHISGLGDPPSLGTFDLAINFDPAILSFNHFAFGDPLLGDQLDPTGGGNTITFTNPGFGSVELFDLSLDGASALDTLQTTNFVMGVLAFDTIGSGSSAVGLTIVALGDAEGNPLLASIQDGSVSVSSVPEPSAASLLGIIFILTGLCRSRLTKNCQ